MNTVLITISGLQGTGKSIIANAVYELLARYKIDTLLTNEDIIDGAAADRLAYLSYSTPLQVFISTTNAECL